MERRRLDVTAFDEPRQFGEMFKAQYCPTIVARANAAKDGREGELNAALDAFCHEQDLGSDGDARFELEYLLAVGTRA